MVQLGLAAMISNNREQNTIYIGVAVRMLAVLKTATDHYLDSRLESLERERAYKRSLQTRLVRNLDAELPSVD